MKVICIKDIEEISKKENDVVEAIKQEDGTFIVETLTVKAADMKTMFKKYVEPEVEDDAISISSSVDTFGGDIGALAEALSAAQGGCSNGKKDAAAYGYKFMELGQLIEIVRPNLAKNKLSLIQTHSYKKGIVSTTTTIIHKSGGYYKNVLDLPITKMKNLTEPQQIGVAATYARRYALQSMMLVSSEKDTDGSDKL